MRTRLSVRAFVRLTLFAGCAVAVGVAPSANFDYVGDHPVGFALLAGGVLLGELMPMKIPRRGDDEEITISTSFSLALLLVGGFAPALLVQLASTFIQDLTVRKPWWRIRFNLGQYTLSMIGAWIVLRTLSTVPHTSSPTPFTSDDLPVVLLSAAAFFAINTGTVGTAVALYQGVALRKYFRNDMFFSALTGGVLLSLAPIVAATASYSTALLPLFGLPMLAIYRAGNEAARSEHAARHDVLTGLPNRIAFRNVVDVALEGTRRPACVLLMDLNRFKEVNDTLGHGYGDLLLQRVADCLRGQVSDEQSVARLGGDEFAVFGHVSDRDDALRFAREIENCLRVSFELEQFVVDAEASVGVALYPEDGADLDVLLQKADVAMYHAKKTHAGVALYDESHDHHSPTKLALTADLRSALETDQIVVWYQPILDLRARHVPAMEALVRWEHPDLGLLMPDSFLDLAEHTSLIKPLTQKVLASALRQVSDWDAIGIDVTVAVNVSARILGDPKFAQSVITALADAGVAARQLKLEVTESALMADPALARAVLQELDEVGVEISIDDFGTGYSSLAYLTDLPVSEVKIDRSFVNRMSSGSREAVVVSSTIELGHHLGLRVVAEGVEDEAVKSQLQALGCDAAQGYGISRPLPGPGATKWLMQFQLDGPRPDVTLIEAA